MFDSTLSLIVGLFGHIRILQDAVDAEVWFPAVAVAACIILFGLILIYILRMGSAVQRPRSTTSRENFSEFFNQAEVGIGVIDDEGFFVLSNKSLHDLTGYTATQLTTIGFSSLFADRDDYVEPSKVAGMLDRFGESHQVFLRQRTGALIRVRFLVLPSPTAIRENAEVLLIEAASAEGGGGGERLSGKDSLQDAKDSFLSSLSHDLKTPLTVILGSASMLASEKAYSPELVEAILESGQRLLNEIDGLLLAHSNQSTTARALPVNIDDVVMDAIGDHRDRAERKGITIDTKELVNYSIPMNGIALYRLVNLLLDVIVDRVDAGKIQIALQPRDTSFSLAIVPVENAIVDDSNPVEADRRVEIAGKLAGHLSAKLTTASKHGALEFKLVVPTPNKSLLSATRAVGKAA